MERQHAASLIYWRICTNCLLLLTFSIHPIRYHSPIAQTSSSRKHTLRIYVECRYMDNRSDPRSNCLTNVLYLNKHQRKVGICKKLFSFFMISFLYIFLFHFPSLLLSFPWSAWEVFEECFFFLLKKSLSNIVAFTMALFNVHYTPKSIQSNYQIGRFFADAVRNL